MDHMSLSISYLMETEYLITMMIGRAFFDYFLNVFNIQRFSVTEEL